MWRMLLRKTPQGGAQGKHDFNERCQRFEAGDWVSLITEARQENVHGHRPNIDAFSPDEIEANKLERAIGRIKDGQLTRARQELCAQSLAPGTAATLNALLDPTRRPPELQRFNEEVLTSQPAVPIQLDAKIFSDCLRTAPKGSSGALSGTRYEFLKLAFDDAATLASLTHIAQIMARAQIPPEVATALSTGALTAIQKPAGGIRGIVAGEAMKRLVSKTLAKQFAPELQAACLPYQFGLSTRAGTDCVGHIIRAATDANPRATLLSIDGVGAFDHVKRQCMLGALTRLPSANKLLPYARMTYNRVS